MKKSNSPITILFGMRTISWRGLGLPFSIVLSRQKLVGGLPFIGNKKVTIRQVWYRRL
ncbi:MAG: hypothetical protein R3E32_13170 [Chitinophagales bacterium]